MMPDNVSSYREDKPHLYSLNLMPHEQHSLDALPKDVLEALENGDIELALALLNEKGEGKIASKFKQLQKLAMVGLPLQKFMNRLRERKHTQAQSSWDTGKAKKKGQKKVRLQKGRFAAFGKLLQISKKGVARLAFVLNQIGQVLTQTAFRLTSIGKLFSFFREKLGGKLDELGNRFVSLAAQLLHPPVAFVQKMYSNVQGWVRAQKEKGDRAIQKVRELVEPVIQKVRGKISKFVEKQQERLAPVVTAVKERAEALQKLIQETANKIHLAMIQPVMVRIAAITHGFVQWFNWTQKITSEYRDGMKEALSAQLGRFKKGADHFNAVFIGGVNSLYLLTVDYALSFLERIAGYLQVIFRWLLGQLMRIFFATKKVAVRVGAVFWLILKTISMILWTVVKAFSEAILFGIKKSFRRA